jgi:FtsH-binding integral membrane protein
MSRPLPRSSRSGRTSAATWAALLGLVIFAGYTMFDFQRLRQSQDSASAPFLAASIFLDILNVFLFFLTIFSGGDSR